MSAYEDDRILELLSRAVDRADPVPEHVTEAARESFTWRTIDAELAELVYDSSGQDLTGVRSVEVTRQVTFRAPGIEIEVMVMSDGVRRLVGQLVPPQRATVELRCGGSVRDSATDSLGRFTFSDVGTGPAQITVVTADGAKVVTDWVLV
ncbi:MAG TPA: hypothetical protein VK011_00460 [Acidimicrobiia bacterium]|nr:hypothetical protein [Acidimicrobiia bacterium]